MSAAPALVLGGPFALLLLSPWLATCLFERRAPARTVATFHLLTLLGLAALPVTVLACLALVTPDKLAAALLGLLVLYLSRVAWAAVRVARATRRLVATPTLAAATPLRVSGPTAGVVLVSGPPVAYTLSGRPGQVVVSQGLLDLLDDDERAAMVAHERAHLRLRHHRLLRFAQIACLALGRPVPTAPRAAASLARELEAIADEAAASTVADRRVVARALAKAALAMPAAGQTLAFGDPRDLAYRLDRLTGDRPAEQRRTVATGAVGLLAVGVMVLLNAGAEPPGRLAGLALRALCVGGIGWLCWRGVAPAQRAADQASTSG
jgi:Zn-dependent protease with chaperone function